MTIRRKIFLVVMVGWIVGAAATTALIMDLADIGHRGQYHP